MQAILLFAPERCSNSTGQEHLKTGNLKFINCLQRMQCRSQFENRLLNIEKF